MHGWIFYAAKKFAFSASYTEIKKSLAYERRKQCYEVARSWFEPRNRIPWDVKILFKTHIKFFTVCIIKSTFVLLTLLISALGSPLSKRCCSCAMIILQNGCQLAKRVSDVCGESFTHRKPQKYQGSEQDVHMCALVNITWFEFNKRGHGL